MIRESNKRGAQTCPSKFNWYRIWQKPNFLSGVVAPKIFLLSLWCFFHCPFSQSALGADFSASGADFASGGGTSGSRASAQWTSTSMSVNRSSTCFSSLASSLSVTRAALIISGWLWSWMMRFSPFGGWMPVMIGVTVGFWGFFLGILYDFFVVNSLVDPFRPDSPPEKPPEEVRFLVRERIEELFRLLPHRFSRCSHKMRIRSVEMVLFVRFLQK